jgi:outer membrane protein assembly factor BamB
MADASWERKQPIDRLLQRTAIVAAGFAVVAAALLWWDFGQRQAKNPLDAPEFLALKAQLAKEPRNENLKQQIRQLDLNLRERYFTQRHFTEIGGWLLLDTAIVLVVAAKSAASLRRKVPLPEAQSAPPDHDEQLARGGRWAVAGLVLALVVLAVGLHLGMKDILPVVMAEEAPTVATAQVEAPAAPAPAPDGKTIEEEAARQWPRFRGPGGLGISNAADVPIEWDAASGKSIVWKTPLPLPGHNSPVVWGDHIFLSGADETKREVYCFDAQSGKLLWQKEAPGTPQSTSEPPEVSEDTGYAASTMATDGQRAYAIFANGDVAAFDFAGRLAWSRSLGIPKNSYGHGASLLMYEKLLLVPFDQGAEKDKLSKLMALDGETGKTVWEAAREVPNSWPTPITIPINGKTEIITAANPWVIAYDPANGKEIWRAKCLRQDVGPSPVFADGIVFVANEFPCLSAIRADGEGDVTKSHILWKGEDGLPDTASPLATEQFVFLLASAGMLTCYDAKEGGVLWEQEFDASFSSSPSMVGNRMYLFGKEGKCWVVEPGKEECKIVAESDLGEECVTSPAFQPGRMYIRGSEHLFCIGGP